VVIRSKNASIWFYSRLFTVKMQAGQACIVVLSLFDTDKTVLRKNVFGEKAGLRHYINATIDCHGPIRGKLI
jgi:hypothetical protein